MKKEKKLDQQYLDMKAYCDEHDDDPDGAFFALAEDIYGWTVDDWVWYADYKKKNKLQ